MSRSRATGKLQATLKVMLYLFSVFFLFGRFFGGSSIAQFAISTSFCVPFGFNFLYIGSFWQEMLVRENIPLVLILFKNRKNNFVLIVFSQLPVRHACKCARSVETSILCSSPAVSTCCLRLRYGTSLGKTLTQRSKTLQCT